MGLRARSLGLVVALVAACALAWPAIATAQGGILDLPVSFAVHNTNNSRVPCGADGEAYTVRGHLVGPASALQSGTPSAATLYLHGLDLGEWFWRFDAVPGYDYALQMAKAGFVSVTIDRLGYGASDHPDGDLSCVGAQATVAHQIIGMLRAGTYHVDGGSPVAFSKIALAGHSIGGAIAQVEAYSFNDIDALLVMSWADQGYTNTLEQSFLSAGSVCAEGGQQSSPGGPGGYAYFAQTDADFRADFFDSATPKVITAATALRERNPCGDMASALQTVAVDDVSLSQITVPVLVVGGENDALFTTDGFRQQKNQFTGSRDVSLVLLPDTGHALTLERTAPQFRAAVGSWLDARGFRAP